MAKRHILVRLPEDILADMDRALAELPRWSRDDIVKAAVELWLYAPEDLVIDASIIASYTRTPADRDDDEPLFAASYEALEHTDEW